MIEVFKKGDERFAVVDNIWGLLHFQKRTRNRLLRPIESPQGKVYLKGTFRFWVAMPLSGKSTASEQDTEKWAQDEELNAELEVLGLPPPTNKHLKMEWCLHEARKRAGVLGMDYGTQSQDYIMEAASQLMLYTLDCAEDDLRPPWKVNVEAALAPYPLRNYMWTAIKWIADKEAKKLLDVEAKKLPESKAIEIVGFTPDKPLYENALQKRQAGREEIIRLGQPMAPPEIVSWIDIKAEEVIDELIRTGRLPGVPKNYRNSYEKKSYAVRRLFRLYSQELLGKYTKTRSLIGINRRLDRSIYVPDPLAFEEEYSLPYLERAVELFGPTGLGPFKPDTDRSRVKVEPPGLPWLTREPYSPFQTQVYIRVKPRKYYFHNELPPPDKPSSRRKHA